VAPPRIVPLAPPLPTRHSGFLGLSQHGASLSATRLIRRGRFPSDCLLARVKSQSHRGRMSEAAAQTSCSDIPNGDLRCILQGDTIEKEARGLRCCSCPPDRRHCACGYISEVPNGYMSVVYLLFLQEQGKRHHHHSGGSLRGETIEKASPKTQAGGSDEVPRGRRSERVQTAHTIKDGNPLIDERGSRRRMRGRLVDGHGGSRRRMRGRLDVVDRERQGQEAILCLSKSTSSDLFTGP
jgi:hypothetical protein